MTKLHDFPMIKMHGCGNDFIIVNAMEKNIDAVDPREVRSLCDRTFGVGADGLVVLEPSTTALAKWTFYNNDGSTAEMCGNAARCAVKYLHEKYFAQKLSVSIETQIGVIQGRSMPTGNIEVGILPAGAFQNQYEEKIIRGPEDEAIRCYCINTGVPHAVVEVENIRSYPIQKIGSFLVKHPAFGSAGTNVTFFQKTVGSEILSTTFERGVEKETFACGTGVAASAVMFSQLYYQPLPIRVSTPGGVIEVDISPTSKILLLRGPAEYVMEVHLTGPLLHEPRSLFEGSAT